VEPRADEPVFDEPAFAEPVFAEPVFTEPVLAEPVLAEPAFDASTLQPPSRESLAAPALLPGDPEPAPPAEPGPVRAAAGDDDDAYEEFEPNRVPMILLVLLIVVIVGYFGIYLPTRDSGDDSPLDDVPGQGDDAATTTSVAVALAEDDAHGVTVEL
jgi:hypothetical protein